MSKQKPTENDPVEKMRQAADALKKANKDAAEGKTAVPKNKQGPKKKFKNAKAAAAFLAAASMGLGGAAILTGDTNTDMTEDKSVIEYEAPAPSTSSSIDLNDFSLSYDYNYNSSPTVTPFSSYDYGPYLPYSHYDISPVDPMFDSYSPYDNYSPLNPYHRLPY